MKSPLREAVQRCARMRAEADALRRQLKIAEHEAHLAWCEVCELAEVSALTGEDVKS